MMKQELDRPEDDDKVKALMLFRKKMACVLSVGKNGDTVTNVHLMSLSM